MRLRKGPLYRSQQEQVIVLRAIPQGQQQDDSDLPKEERYFSYGNMRYRKREYQEIVGQSANRKICISKRRIAFDPSGIPISTNDLIGVSVPPIENMKVDDLLVRLDKDLEELYIEGITNTLGIQEIELANRDKIRPGVY